MGRKGRKQRKREREKAEALRRYYEDIPDKAYFTCSKLSLIKADMMGYRHIDQYVNNGIAFEKKDILRIRQTLDAAGVRYAETSVEDRAWLDELDRDAENREIEERNNRKKKRK